MAKIRQRRGAGRKAKATTVPDPGGSTDTTKTDTNPPPPRRRVEDTLWFTWLHRIAVTLFVLGTISILYSGYYGQDDEDTRILADDRTQELALRVCRAGKADLLENITARVRLAPHWEDAGGMRLPQAILAGWHHVVETQPLATHATYPQTLLHLLKQDVVDLGEACPLVEAVIFRNTPAIEMLVSYGNYTSRSLQNATALDAWEVSLQTCLKERGFYGQHVLHHAAKTRASGFARLFSNIKAGLGSPNGTVSPVVISMLNSTLELLQVDSKPLTEPLTFTGLNAATPAWEVRRLFKAASGMGATYTFFSRWLKTQDDRGLTPIHNAARDGMTDALFLMLDNAGKLDVHDYIFGFTAAHYAIVSGNQSVCDELRLRDPGCFVREDRFGRAGWQIARARGTAAGVCAPPATDLTPAGLVAEHDTPAAYTDPQLAVTCGADCQLHAQLDWHWMSAAELAAVGIDLVRLFEALTPVRALSMATFSADPDLFPRDHESLNLPVVVRGGLQLKRPLGPHWARSAFQTRFKNLRATTGDVPYAVVYGRATKQSVEALGTFANLAMGVKPEMTSPPTSPPRYVFDSSLLHSRAGSDLLSELGLPDVMTNRNLTLQQTALGPPLTGAAPHFHPAAWNGVVFGRKLWLMWPPAFSEFVGSTPVWEWFVGARKGLEASVRHQPGTPFVALQGPGDLVYVPSGWSHAVINLADTFAVALESYE